MIGITILILALVLLVFFIDFSAEWSLLKFIKSKAIKIKDINEHWEVEQFFRNSIWTLSIVIIILLFWYWLYTKNIINIIAPMLSVIAFWYWYDKYKRDKETDILQKNLDFKKDLLSSEISEIEKVSLIYSEFERVRDMRERGYMSEEIFENIKLELKLLIWDTLLFLFVEWDNNMVGLNNMPILVDYSSKINILWKKEEKLWNKKSLLDGKHIEAFLRAADFMIYYEHSKKNYDELKEIFQLLINDNIRNGDKKYIKSKINIVKKFNKELKDESIPEEFHLKINNNTNQ